MVTSGTGVIAKRCFIWREQGFWTDVAPGTVALTLSENLHIRT